MFTIYVKFKCFDGKREAFVERVKKEGILDKIRAEDGCRCYNYYYSDADSHELLLIEAWDSEKHQQIHIGQPHMADLRALKGEYIEDTVLGEFELKS